MQEDIYYRLREAQRAKEEQEEEAVYAYKRLLREQTRMVRASRHWDGAGMKKPWVVAHSALLVSSLPLLWRDAAAPGIQSQHLVPLAVPSSPTDYCCEVLNSNSPLMRAAQEGERRQSYNDFADTAEALTPERPPWSSPSTTLLSRSWVSPRTGQLSAEKIRELFPLVYVGGEESRDAVEDRQTGSDARRGSSESLAQRHKKLAQLDEMEKDFLLKPRCVCVPTFVMCTQNIQVYTCWSFPSNK